MEIDSYTSTEAHGKPWLSILIPSYNVEAYIGECLETAIRQVERSGVEIIVADDASTDGTVAIVEETCRKYPHLLRLEKISPNAGPYRARNLLLDMARGEYVWFVDADDRIRQGAVGSLGRIVADHQPDLIICDFSTFGEGEEDARGKYLHGHMHSFVGPSRQLLRDRSILVGGMFRSQRLQTWSKIFRRNLASGLKNRPVGRHFEDIAFSSMVALEVSSFYYEPSPWIDYRQRAGSIVSRMTPDKFVDLTRAVSLAGEALAPHAAVLSDQARYAFRYFCVRHFIISIRGLLAYPPGAERNLRLQECFRLYRRAIVDDGLGMALQFMRYRHFFAWVKLLFWKARARFGIWRTKFWSLAMSAGR